MMVPSQLVPRVSFHNAADLGMVRAIPIPFGGGDAPSVDLTLENFFHPLVGKLIQRLNESTRPNPIADLCDPAFLGDPFSNGGKPVTAEADYQGQKYPNLPSRLNFEPKQIDLGHQPYAGYNWELFYHIPVGVAVHLSSMGRYEEAASFFHLVFDPTSPDGSAWRFLGFRQPDNLAAHLTGLGTNPNQPMQGYDDSASHPFMPHRVARGRPIAYRYYVVMKYLDNLIAWGDSLFANPTIETVNEATLCYVQAANLLGPRPQQVPRAGTVSPKTFNDLSQAGLNSMGDAIVELEAQFPFNLTLPGMTAPSGSPIAGIARTLYFCWPSNSKLLGYWDVVADRLFKVRHCLNLQGQPQPLPLFDPPIDPGMLVKAAAAGLDVTSIVNGLSQPVGPVRSVTRIQKAMELCSEVRSFGAALLAAMEKGDAELLTQIRQTHEISIQGMTQDARFLQWKQAHEATEILLKNRETVVERYAFYLRLMGQVPDGSATTTPSSEPPDLDEGSFDSVYADLVTKYDLPIAVKPYPPLDLAETQSPEIQAGGAGSGQLHLNKAEDEELNSLLPLARDTHLASTVTETLSGVLGFIPDFNAKVSPFGVGLSTLLFGGDKLSNALQRTALVLRIVSEWSQAQAGMDARRAGHQRRADEWLLQANLAARELRQIGRQIISSLIAEQVAKHEYELARTQVAHSQDILAFLTGEAVSLPDGSRAAKFTTAELYGWMQGELSRLYYQCYRMALDAARKAEQTVKRELMRPELDAATFIQPSYYDSGRQGLLSGEALYLDLRRLEAAYLDSNRRELELTAHVSLRQLDATALLALKMTGTCTFTIPETHFDRTCPGHYLRRIKSVALSVPSVVGPYTGVNCTLAIQKSIVRVSPVAGDDYANPPDDKVQRYYGSAETLVTSSATNDSGMFETNLRDDRFLPFEGQGACSTWTLSLPDPSLPPFDYATISDVILHIRYTARDGGSGLRGPAVEAVRGALGAAAPPLLVNPPYDFPTDWSAFINGQTPSFDLPLRMDYFPFLVQGMRLGIGSVVAVQTGQPPTTLPTPNTELSFANPNTTVKGVITRKPPADVFLLVNYTATPS